MSKYVCFIPGARGRSIEVYDNKCIIRTSVTAGSVLTGNAADGRKTIFYLSMGKAGRIARFGQISH